MKDPLSCKVHFQPVSAHLLVYFQATQKSLFRFDSTLQNSGFQGAELKTSDVEHNDFFKVWVIRANAISFENCGKPMYAFPSVLTPNV